MSTWMAGWSLFRSFDVNVLLEAACGNHRHEWYSLRMKTRSCSSEYSHVRYCMYRLLHRSLHKWKDSSNKSKRRSKIVWNNGRYDGIYGSLEDGKCCRIWFKNFEKLRCLRLIVTLIILIDNYIILDDTKKKSYNIDIFVHCIIGIIILWQERLFKSDIYEIQIILKYISIKIFHFIFIFVTLLRKKRKIFL